MVSRMQRIWCNAALFSAACLLLACPSEVQIEDDGAGGGAAPIGTGTGPTGAGGDGTGTGALDAQRIEDACRTMCLSGCGKASDCTADCVAQYPNVLPACTDAVVALLGCRTKKGDTLSCPDAYEDCYDLLTAYHGCQNPLHCGSLGDLLDCDPPEGSSCGCRGDCDAGHTAGSTCTFDVETGIETCTCSFDGVLVGECESSYRTSCDVRSSVCCAPFWR